MEIVIIIESLILALFGLAIVNMLRRIKILENNQTDVSNLEKRLQKQNVSIYNAVMTKVDEINPSKKF